MTNTDENIDRMVNAVRDLRYRADKQDKVLKLLEQRIVGLEIAAKNAENERNLAEIQKAMGESGMMKRARK